MKNTYYKRNIAIEGKTDQFIRVSISFVWYKDNPALGSNYYLVSVYPIKVEGAFEVSEAFSGYKWSVPTGRFSQKQFDKFASETFDGQQVDRMVGRVLEDIRRLELAK